MPAPSAPAGGMKSNRVSLRRLAGDPRFLGIAWFIALIPFLFLHRIGREDVETDFFWEYAPYAERIRSGHLPELFAYRGPGYHLLLALLSLPFRDFFLAGRILSAIAAAGFVGLTAWTARRAAGPRAAVVAALFVAFQPQVLLHSWSVGTDMVFAALAMATVALLLAGGIRRVAGAALLAGYAWLTRPNGLFLLPAGLTLLWLGRAQPRPAEAAGPGGRPRLLPRAAVFIALFALPVGAWALAHHAAHGGWPASYSYRNLLAAASPDLRQAGTSVYQQVVETKYTGLGDVLRERGGKLAVHTLQNVPVYLLQNAHFVLGWGLFAALLAGIFLLARGRPDRRAWGLPLAGAWFFLVMVPAYYEPRFFIFLSAPTAFLAAAAVVDFRTDAWRPWRLSSLKPGRPAAIVAAALLVATAVTGLHTSISALQREALLQPAVDAARIIRSLPQVRGAVSARKPHVAWWAGRRMVGIPQASPAALPDSLRAAGAAFLYYGSVELRLLPQYAALLTPDGVPAGLTLVSVAQGQSFGALFQVLPAGDRTPPVPADLRLPLQHLAQTLDEAGISRQVAEQHELNQYNRGMFLVTQRRFEEAVEPLRAAVATDSTFPEASLFLGYALVETGRYAEGLAALDRARRLGKDTPELQLNRGRALVGLARYPEAEAQYRECRRRDPANPASAYQLGLVEMGLGRHAAADSLFRLAGSLGLTANPDLDAARGKALLELGRDAEAERLLADAVRRAPRHASLGILHGFALYRLQRINEARAELQRVLEIDPGNEQARRYLEALPPQ